MLLRKLLHHIVEWRVQARLIVDPQTEDLALHHFLIREPLSNLFILAKTIPSVEKANYMLETTHLEIFIMSCSLHSQQITPKYTQTHQKSNRAHILEILSIKIYTD